MAVLNSCPGVEVKILSNKKDLKEYADTKANDPPNSTTRYIEVELDGAFEVHLQFTDQYSDRYGVRVDVKLDGHKVAGRLYRASRVKNAAGHTLAGAQKKIRGRWHISNFRFSLFALDLNPHAEIDEVTKKRLTSTGIVTVLIHRVKNIRSRRSKRTAQTTEALPHEVPKLGPVPKEAVKDLGLSHYGSVDNPEKKKGVRSFNCTTVDGGDAKDAVAIFNFKYRSRASLQALHVLSTQPETTTSAPATLQTSLSTPQPVMSRDREVQLPLPLRRSSTFTATPTLRPRSTAFTFGDIDDGLTEQELIALISYYRGSSDGLANQGRLRLQVLLGYYENNSPFPQSEKPRTEQERSNSIRLKRERESDGSEADARKRSKQDVIIIDD